MVVREIETDTYDYVVCGGGTAGCVIAGRLAEDLNATILILEAGQDNVNLENVHMPGGWSNNFDSVTDWNIITEPMPGVDDRRVKCSRGRFLGGCSGVNGTLCIRGIKQDYDDWEMQGWSGDEMFKYMAKAETFHGKDWFHASDKDHGYSGPLHTEPHELAPISELVKQSLIDQGLPWHEDMFTMGETPQGCGNATRTVHQGLRSTAADFITKGYRRDNITIKTDVTVNNVVLSDTAEGLQASGVSFILKSGETGTVKARKEVIVSAGAYCSPTILLRSGIGAKFELEKLGIPCKVDLPGVGQNLMDHVLAFVFYETEKEGLTNDHLAYHGDGLASSYKLWKDQKTGVLSTFPFGTFAYTRLDQRLKDDPLWVDSPRRDGRDPMDLTLKQPNLEFWNTELYGGPKQFVDFPINKKHAFAMCTLLFNARSRGRVSLKSADPMENPIVDHNYLADPLDLLVLSEGCRYANEIVMNGKGTKDIIKGSWPPELTHHSYTTREQWVPYVKQQATTCYHAAGTCKMGKADDPSAVLDEKLRIRGVKGLRVADVSIMPLLNSGHTQMPAYGIGEKAADLIKADA